MSKITFLFSKNGIITKIEGRSKGIFREEAIKYAKSIKKTIYEIFFVYQEKKIHINSRIEDLNKNKKEEMEIFVYDEEKKILDNIIKYKILGKEDKIKIFGDTFVENNKNNFRISLDDKNELELVSFLDLKNNEKYIKINKIIEIKLIQINEVTNLSMMFQGCRNIISVPDLSTINTDNITDISFMFSNCNLLTSLPDLSIWNTSKLRNMSSLFYGCSSLTSLFDISYWDTSQVTNMSFTFYKCSSLKYLPDLSKWDTSEVVDMSYMFYGCSSLTSLPDINKWNRRSLKKMSYMLTGCTSLKVFPNLMDWANQIINDKDDIEGDITDKNYYMQMESKHYYFTCKNKDCDETPEIISKKDNVILKCNKCNITETENIEKLCNLESLWLKEIIRYCNIHKNVTARKFCKTCKLYLCRQCLDKHKESKTNHDYLAIKDINFNLCEEHKQKFTHYCIDCDKEICERCISGHPNHEVNDVQNMDIDNDEKLKKIESDRKDKQDDEIEEDNKNNNKKEEKEEKEKEKEKGKDKEAKEKKEIDEKKEVKAEKEKNKEKEEVKVEEKEEKKEKDEKDKKEKEEEKEKEVEKEKKEKEEIKKKKKIFNLSIFEKFFNKAINIENDKEKNSKELISFIDVLKEQYQDLEKSYKKCSDDNNNIINHDKNLIILAKLLFITYKNSKSDKKDEIALNYGGILDVLRTKFSKEEIDKFKEYVVEQKQNFILATQNLTEDEKNKLKKNINFQFGPIDQNISDLTKTKDFLMKNIELTKILKKSIIIEKVKDPDNIIDIEKEINNPNNLLKPLNSVENGPFILSLCGKCMKNEGTEVLISKNKDKQFENIEQASINSLISFGDQKKYELFLDYGKEENNDIINNVLKKEKKLMFFKKEIAKALNIDKKEILVDIESYEDIEENKMILKLTFSLLNQSKDFTEEINNFIEKYNVLKRFNIKPVLEALKFSPHLLDPLGDKSENWCTNNIRGGETYIPPSKDWFGIGIKVKDKYENNDWLDCQNKKGEYAIAYLGINNLLNKQELIIEDTDKYSRDISNMISQKIFQFETNINTKGFCCEKCGPKCGNGVCLFQNPQYAENGAGIVDIQGYRIKIILMCRVNPVKIRQPKSFPECWILNPTSDEIRPYRILIKKVPFSPLVGTVNNTLITCQEPVKYIENAINSKDLSFTEKLKKNPDFEDVAKIEGQELNNDFFIIRLYTSVYFGFINQYLRTEVPLETFRGFKGFTREELNSWICCLQLALSRNRNVKDGTIVYRGASLKFSSDIQINSRFYFREFLSTSTKKEFCLDWIKNKGTIMEITIKNNGTNDMPNYCYYIEDITYTTEQYEVLFSSHCYFVVTKIIKTKDIDYVHLICLGNGLELKKKEELIEA